MRKSFSCLLIMLVLLILAILGLAGTAIMLPHQAELAFGPPAAGIEFSQRIYLSYLLLSQQAILKHPSDVAGIVRPFQVELGESTYAITQRLQDEEFVSDAQALRNYLIYSGKDTSIQAGEYSLSSRMSPIEIAQRLQDATPGEVTFHVLPGWRMEEIAAALPTSGLSFSPEAFMAAAANPGTVDVTLAQFIDQTGRPAGATLEGYFFPDGYRLSRQIDVNTFVNTLLENFRFKIEKPASGDYNLIQGFENQGLTIYQAAILASIIQREAIIDDEMPQIASVFFNRMAAGMKLDSDPTVQYALGYNPAQNTWWTNPLSLENLSYDSLYNTYLYPGLPPGPIANPSLNALKAVAFPAQTPYYYFRAACDGSGLHAFAVTFEEHQQNACP
jgi:UPF0755 protein